MKKWIVLAVVLILLGGGYYFAKPYFFQDIEIEELSELEVLEQLTGGQDSVDIEEGDEELVNFIPTFSEVSTDFTHVMASKSEAFTGSALIDIDGDGVEEVFVGGGGGQQDALLKFDGEKFVNIASEVGIDGVGQTLGALSVDSDNDDDVDLFVARNDGVYFYKNDSGVFEEMPGAFDFPEKSVPFAIASTDLGNDGFVDLYVSTFIHPDHFKAATFNDPNHLTKNVFFMSQEEGEFVDVTHQLGIDFEQNTFLSAFVDLNNDNLVDFVSATNTDKVRIYENLGSGFKEVENVSDYGFWMGLSVSDVDNDGDVDLFFTNIGNTVPVSTARGDLRADQVLDPEWILLINDGDFKFTQVNEELGLTGYEFAWGADFADFNMDGREDLVVVENYVKWPAHKLNKLPGRFLLQGIDGRFIPIGNVAKVENPYYGMTPLVSDFNEDGYPDIVYVNLDGPVRAYLNNGGDNHYLVVSLPDNANSLGAEVIVKTSRGVLRQQYVSSTGLISDQSSNLYFGLGNATLIESVEVRLLKDAESKLFEDVDVDSVLKVL